MFDMSTCQCMLICESSRGCMADLQFAGWEGAVHELLTWWLRQQWMPSKQSDHSWGSEGWSHTLPPPPRCFCWYEALHVYTQGVLLFLGHALPCITCR